MRIALVNNFYLPRTSGSSHLVDSLATGMAARGHEVLVITSAQGAPAGEERRNGFRVVRLPCRALPDIKLAMRYDVNFAASPRNLRRVFRLLDDFAPDVIHQHGQFFDLTWMSAIWSRRRKVPTVLTVHTPLIQTKPIYGFVLWLADMILVRPFLAVGRPTIVFVDWFMGEYVKRRYRPPEDRLASIPIGVDPDRFGPADAGPTNMTKGRIGVGDRPVILSLGHVIPLRDRLALVEALPHILRERPDVAVVVVGNVNDERFLHRAEELGVRDALIVTGAVTRDEVPSYVAIADAEAHDLQGYGLGTASLEVMAAGVPVVSVVRTDNFPGLELRSWDNIVIVPADDPVELAKAMLRLISDRELADRVGRGQREFIVKYFAMDAVTDQHMELYEKVIGAAAYG